MLSALKQGMFSQNIRKKLKSFVGGFFRNGQISDNKLFVMTFDNNYTCNARYIVDEIIRQKLPVDIVWAGEKATMNSSNFPPQVRVVKCKSVKMFKEQATAKIWLDNALGCLWYDIPKKKEQIYINTWHGSMGIKKLKGNPQWMEYAEKCKTATDYVIANSTFEEEVYRTTFWPEVPVWKCGHARNDILFEKEKMKKIKEEVAEFFGVDTGKKFLLYAPTFRDSGDVSCYNIDYKALKESLEKKYGGEWVILVRMHYKNRTGDAAFQPDSWLKDAGGYSDMQKLMAASDFGITDYSSWAYDYVLTRRPMILYAPDAEQYENGRGLYYPLEETPFPIAKNNAELSDTILSFDEAVYQPGIDAFLAARGCYEQGNASKQIVDNIKKLMNITD